MIDESKVRARVFDVIRRILDIPVATGSITKNVRKDFLRPPHITEFQGIDPILLYGTDRDWFFHPIDCSPSVLWPVDVCCIQARGGENLGLTVQRWRSISMKDVRGLAKIVSPFMFRRDLGVENFGKFEFASGVYSYVAGGWSDAVPNKYGPKDTDFEAGGVAIAVALRQRYEWAVNIGFGNSPSVRIATDPTGLKELFRLRDVADGRNRRDALMTWVSDHWREDRKDPDVETYVRKHMRGAVKFEWRGMECEIKPSAFDVEQRERYIADRVKMRDIGADKRTVA